MGLSSSREREFAPAGASGAAELTDDCDCCNQMLLCRESVRGEIEAHLDHIKTLKDAMTFAREEVECVCVVAGGLAGIRLLFLRCVVVSRADHQLIALPPPPVRRHREVRFESVRTVKATKAYVADQGKLLQEKDEELSDLLHGKLAVLDDTVAEMLSEMKEQKLQLQCVSQLEGILRARIKQLKKDKRKKKSESSKHSTRSETAEEPAEPAAELAQPAEEPAQQQSTHDGGLELEDRTAAADEPGERTGKNKRKNKRKASEHSMRSEPAEEPASAQQPPTQSSGLKRRVELGSVGFTAKKRVMGGCLWDNPMDAADQPSDQPVDAGLFSSSISPAASASGRLSPAASASSDESVQL
jgi:hypothetical protein